MENLFNDNESSELALTCEQHKAILTAGLEPYQVLSLTVPLDTTVWEGRDEAWMITFSIYVAVSSLIFLLLGLLSTMLFIKKDCLRLPTKTFFAIYSSTAVFGFSRSLCLVLDQYGLFGYIGDPFPAWFIVSRMLGAFGFPSLVASTTLIIFTLLKVAKANPGKQWYHYWKFIIPIMLIPYIISFTAELIGNFTPYPGLLIVLVCEVFFAVWGLLICIAFLFAGNRLLRQLNLRGRKTVRISAVRNSSNRGDMEAQMATRHQFASREQQRHQIRTRRTTRKITIITYGTALFTISYSLLSIAAAIMTSILLYSFCLGFNGQALSSIWLAFEVSKRVNEIVLGAILLYSITDIAGMMKVIYGRCCKRGVEQHNSHGPCYLNKGVSQMSMLTTSTSERQLHAIGSMESLNENLEREDFILDANDQTVQISDNLANGQDLGEVAGNSHESRDSETPSQYHIITGSQTNSPCHTDSTSSVSTDLNHIASVGESVSEITVIESPIDDQSLARSTYHSQQSLEQRTIGTQTSDLTDSTTPDLQAQHSKPVPKPRKSRPKKSKNQVLNEQRIAALRQAPNHTLSSLQSRILRKQTI